MRYHREPRFDPVEAVRQRVIDSFETNYVAFLSILQGAVLAHLLLTKHDEGWRSGAEEVMLTIGTILTVITVWEEYRIGTTIFRWAPRLLDTLLPFLLVGCEAWMVESLKANTANWYVADGTLLLVGALAYWHMYYRSSLRPDLNEAMLLAVGRWRYVNVAACLCVGLGNLLVAGIVAATHSDAVRDWVAISAVALPLVLIIRGEIVWHDLLKSIDLVPKQVKDRARH